MEPKHLLASKTFWANLIALVATLSAGYGLEITEEAQAQIATGVLAVANIFLRMITSRPVTLRRTKQ